MKVERRRGRLVTARLGEQHRSHNHHHDGGPIHRPEPRPHENAGTQDGDGNRGSQDRIDQEHRKVLQRKVGQHERHEVKGETSQVQRVKQRCHSAAAGSSHRL